MKPYAQYKTNGKLWRAGKTIIGLCAAYNHATNPGLFMSDQEHIRSRVYARAIRNRMRQFGFQQSWDYIELSNGALWPKKGLPE